MRNAVRATAIVAAAAAAWAAAASAAPPWSGPADISGVFATAGYDGMEGNPPDIAADGDGDTAAAWDEEGRVVVAERPHGGAWSIPTPLGTGVRPHVAEAAGVVAVAWSADPESHATVAVRTSDGVWTAADFGPSNGDRPVVGIDANGAVTALWAADGIKTAVFQPGTGWAGVTTLTAAASYDPQLSVSASGRAIAAWTAASGVGMALRAADGAWAPATVAGPAGEGADVSMNARGDWAIAWRLFGADGASVHATSRTAEGLGVPSQEISDPVAQEFPFLVPEPVVAVGPTGRTALVWNRARGDSSRLQSVEAASGTAGLGFGSPDGLSGDMFTPIPTVAVGPGGEAIAMWRDGGIAASAGAAADWMPGASPAPAGSSPRMPDVVIDAAGDVHAVWADLARIPPRPDFNLFGMAVQATLTVPFPPGPPPPGAGGPGTGVPQGTPRSTVRRLRATLSAPGRHRAGRPVRMVVRFSRVVTRQRVVLEVRRRGGWRAAAATRCSGRVCRIVLRRAPRQTVLLRVRFSEGSVRRHSPTFVLRAPRRP